jgi:aspartyl aminopeptidase
MSDDPKVREVARDLLDFIASSPSPYHAVRTAAERLEAAGFRPLAEEEAWTVEPGGRYYVARGGTSLAAWVTGAEPLERSGLRIIGAHTDSPTLRLKPDPAIALNGYRQLGVEVYGGPLLETWTDRDLGLAGRVVVSAGGGIESRLLRIDRPIARIPQLAIHLNREANEKGLQLNRETHLPPIIGLEREGWEFRGWLASQVGVDPERVIDHDLMLYDCAPPTFAGLSEEFLLAPRLDNLASSHAALTALLESSAQPAASARVVALYDDEEIGSETAQGAAGTLLVDLVARLAELAGGGEAVFRARARSILVSADMAHAVHPNYTDRHEARHMPRLNGGPVVKYNANARYATEGDTAALFLRACAEAEVPSQRFVMRADMPCGTTIGPILSARLGVRTVDVGSPMLAMHSCREMAGAEDPAYMVRALRRFLGA